VLQTGGIEVGGSVAHVVIRRDTVNERKVEPDKASIAEHREVTILHTGPVQRR
jgi:hypothetical protein